LEPRDIRRTNRYSERAEDSRCLECHETLETDRPEQGFRTIWLPWRRVAPPAVVSATSAVEPASFVCKPRRARCLYLSLLPALRLSRRLIVEGLRLSIFAIALRLLPLDVCATIR
jgi:hypothetical protein